MGDVEGGRPHPVWCGAAGGVETGRHPGMMVVGRSCAVVDMEGSGAGSHGTPAACNGEDAARA